MNENERRGNSRNAVNHWDSGKHLFVKLHRTPMGMVTQCYMMNNWRNRLWWQVWLSISENSNRDNQTRINWYPSSIWNTSKVKTQNNHRKNIHWFLAILCFSAISCTNFLLLRCWCKQNSTKMAHELLWEKVTTFHGSKQLMLHSHVFSCFWYENVPMRQMGLWMQTTQPSLTLIQYKQFPPTDYLIMLPETGHSLPVRILCSCICPHWGGGRVGLYLEWVVV